MPRKLDPHTVNFRREPHHRSYPWDEWFDGSIWELEPGDYDGTAASFRAHCIYMARGFDYKLRTKIEGDLLFIQALDCDGNPLQPGS